MYLVVSENEDDDSVELEKIYNMDTFDTMNKYNSHKWLLIKMDAMTRKYKINKIKKLIKVNE